MANELGKCYATRFYYNTDLLGILSSINTDEGKTAKFWNIGEGSKEGVIIRYILTDTPGTPTGEDEDHRRASLNIPWDSKFFPGDHTVTFELYDENEVLIGSPSVMDTKDTPIF